MRPARWNRTLFGWLLRLLPREFRADFGDAMRADFDHRQREEGTAAAWRRELPSLVVTAASEHVRGMCRELAYGVRLLRRTPALTAAAILMLALGIGANIAVFSVIDAAMLRSPFAEPDRLVIVRVSDAKNQFTSAVTYDQLAALQAASGPFEHIGWLDSGEHVLTWNGERRRLDIECVSASLFTVLGTPAAHGRVFSAAETRPGAAPLLVLSDDFWTELGRPPDIIGRTLTLNGTPVSVVGIMPRGFDGAYSDSDTDGWLPIGVPAGGDGLTGCTAGAFVNAFAKLRPGIRIDDARAMLPGVQLLSLPASTVSELRTPFLILSGAVLCVLLIACLNVGGLQMERAVARRRELAVRRALGATRWRLIRQLLIESAALASLGSLAGLGVAFVALGGLISLLPANLPHLDEIAIDGRALAAATVIAAVAAIISGLVPALVGRNLAATGPATSSRAASSGGDWSRRVFAAIQLALSLLVLIGAGLMIRTFLILRPAEPGFDSTHKLVTLVRRPAAGPDESAAFLGRLVASVAEMPAVRGVAATSYYPMSGTVSTGAVVLDTTTVSSYGAVTTPGYFELMKIPIIAGRAFSTQDSPGSTPVAIVSETLARRLHPDGAVLGARVRAPAPRRPGARPTEWTIVGISASTRCLPSHVRPCSEYYVPFLQSPISTMYVIADTMPGEERVVTEGIRDRLSALDPMLAIEPIQPLREMLDRRVGSRRLGAWLLGIFAAIAVALAAVGFMSTIGWWVAQRKREIGIRIALGASRPQLTRLVLRQASLIALTGIVVGLASAAALTRYFESWIYGVTPLDPASFAGAALLVVASAGAALALPLRRAHDVDPIIALRSE